MQSKQDSRIRRLGLEALAGFKLELVIDEAAAAAQFRRLDDDFSEFPRHLLTTTDDDCGVDAADRARWKKLINQHDEAIARRADHFIFWLQQVVPVAIAAAEIMAATSSSYRAPADAEWRLKENRQGVKLLLNLVESELKEILQVKRGSPPKLSSSVRQELQQEVRSAASLWRMRHELQRAQAKKGGRPGPRGTDDERAMIEEWVDSGRKFAGQTYSASQLDRLLHPRGKSGKSRREKRQK